MLIYYKQNKAKYEQITKEQAEKENKENMINVFVRPDTGHFIVKKPEKRDTIKKHIKHANELGEFLLFSFDDANSVVNSKLLKKHTFKKFLNLIFGNYSFKYVPVFNVYQDRRSVEYVEPIVNDAPIEYATFLSSICDKAFRPNKGIDVEENRVIESFDMNTDINEILRELSTNVNGFTEGQMLFDFDRNMQKNLSGSPFQVVSAILQDKQKIVRYLHQKGYTLEIDIEWTKTVEASKNKYIVFSGSRVEYNGVDDEGADVKSILFNKGIKPYAFASTKYDFNRNMITDRPKDYFICGVEGDNKPLFISKEIDRKAFNKWYLDRGVPFRGTELQILDFYDALERMKINGDIKENEIVYKNGYLQDRNILVHGGDIVKGEADEVVSVANKYSIELGKNNITVKEGYKLFLNIYEESQATLCYIRMMGAMCCSMFRNMGIKTPLLITTGETQAGKSTLMGCMFEIFNFNMKESARYYTAQGLSPQPILSAAKDHVPLFLDEFTGDVNQKVEEVLRSFFDNVSTAKGRANHNEIYEINSPLIISGERLPGFTSIINRGIMLLLYKASRKGDKATILEIKESSVLNDWFSVISGMSKTDMKTVREKHYRRTICSFDSRINDSCQWMLMVNDIFKLCNDADLVKYLQTMASRQEQYLDFSDEKVQIINRILLANARIGTLSVDSTRAGDVIIRGFLNVLDPKEYKQNIRQIVDAENDFGLEERGPSQMISISLKNLFDKGLSQMYNMVISVARASKNNEVIHSVDDFINNHSGTGSKDFLHQ